MDLVEEKGICHESCMEQGNPNLTSFRLPLLKIFPIRKMSSLLSLLLVHCKLVQIKQITLSQN